MNEWSFFVQMENSWIQDGRIGKMATIIKLSQNEWVKFILCKMAESRMAESKMATIIKLHEKEWLWVILNYWLPFRVRVRVRVFLNESETRLNKVSESRVLWQSGWIQYGRVQDGCHHQVYVRMNEWSFFVQMVGREMWVSFFVQMVGTILGKCEWVWEEKLKWLDPRWTEFKMAAIIKLRENEWVWVRLN